MPTFDERGLTGNSGIIADGLHVSASYSSNDGIFAEVEHPEWGMIWERMSVVQANEKGLPIIRCSMCDNYATSLDHFWPYFSDMNRCDNHLNRKENETMPEISEQEARDYAGMPDAPPEFTKEDMTHFFNHNNKLKVVFTKKDGSERTMLCTKSFNTIPKEHRPADKENVDRPGKPAPDHLFSVFDLQANGWRSFTIANIISIQPA